jgi:diguanylate cyclase (GGDEF)-like protein
VRDALPHSGDSSESPAPVSSESAERRRPIPPRSPVPRPAWLIVLVLVALIPLLIATWTFGRSYRTSELGQVDARLRESAAAVVTSVEAAAGRTSRVAVALARSPSVQSKLFRGKAERLTAPSPSRDIRVEGAPGSAPGAVPRASVSSTALVRADHRAIGHVTAWIPLAALLSRLSVRTGIETVAVVGDRVAAGRLRGSALVVEAGSPRSVRLGNERYRLLRQPLGGGVTAALLVPYAKIEGSVFHRELPTVAAGTLTAVALVLVIALMLPRLRLLRGPSDADDWRRPVALVGDVAVAAHDPEALLPVILETAVVATDADGGAIIWQGEEVAALGTTSAQRQILSLDLGDEKRPDAGKLLLYRRRHSFSARDREMAESLVAQGRIALENARLHDLVRWQAQTDELTDLPNRRRFMSGLEQEISRSGRLGTPLSLVLFDLDRFKRVNDHHGHQVGDVLLRRTADAVRARIRETDLAARIGGEEFAVLLPGSDAAGAATFAEGLRREIEQEVVVEDVPWPTTASFGVAEFHEGMSVETLVGAADRALYEAKAAGRNTVRRVDGADLG